MEPGRVSSLSEPSGVLYSHDQNDEQCPVRRESRNHRRPKDKETGPNVSPSCRARHRRERMDEALARRPERGREETVRCAGETIHARGDREAPYRGRLLDRRQRPSIRCDLGAELASRRQSGHHGSRRQSSYRDDGGVREHPRRIRKRASPRYEIVFPIPQPISHQTECILGVVTQKAREFMKKESEEKAKKRAQSSEGDSHIALKRHKYVFLPDRQASLTHTTPGGSKPNSSAKRPYQKTQSATPSPSRAKTRSSVSTPASTSWSASTSKTR